MYGPFYELRSEVVSRLEWLFLVNSIPARFERAGKDVKVLAPDDAIGFVLSELNLWAKWRFPQVYEDRVEALLEISGCPLCPPVPTREAWKDDVLIWRHPSESFCPIQGPLRCVTPVADELSRGRAGTLELDGVILHYGVALLPRVGEKVFVCSASKGDEYRSSSAWRTLNDTGEFQSYSIEAIQDGVACE